MSVPMSPVDIINQLKRWSISYKEYKDWKTHNRGDRGNGWSDLRGMIIHHTGSDSNDQRELLYSGYSGLPGPLCHFGLDQEGTIHLVGWGRANHAGGGDPTVLAHVTNEDYSGELIPHYGQGDSGAADGNGYFYGVEIWYSGKHAMTTKQYNTLLKLSAAVAEHHKWSEKSFIAHGEWSNDKWDPGFKSGEMMDMANVRKDIATVIKAGPVTIDQPDKKNVIYTQVWEADVAIPPKRHATGSNPTWIPASILRFAAENAEQARLNTEKIMKHLGIE